MQFMMKNDYAIVEMGGKQYKVAAGQKVKFDYMGVGEGAQVELSKVLLIADGQDTIVGNPAIDNALVKATCIGEEKDKKVIVFKYKPKVRYRVKKGHRQLFTRLEIKEIIKPGSKATGKTQRGKKETAVGGEG